jgi:hypothetical protein
MKPLIRFGRRIPIPSTLQIRHELRTFSVEKFMREMSHEKGLTTVANEVASRGATERKRIIDAANQKSFPAC